MQGILSQDSNHLMTTELNYNMSGSMDDSLLAPYTTLAGSYTYYPPYYETGQEYNYATTTPVFLEESYDEGGSYGNLTPQTATNLMLRKIAYQSTLSGGLAGYLYGNNNEYDFPTGWQNNIDTTAVNDLTRWGSFFDGISFYNLVPDASHTFVTSGYGTPSGNNTGNIQTDSYVTAGITPDGTLGVAYLPATSTSITVNMARFTGTTTAQWYDPTNGTYTPASGSPFANTGSHTFSSPGVNSAGDPDRVLLLEASSSPALPTISSFGASPTSIVVGQSSTLSWSVSNDTALTISNGVGNVYNATSAVVYPTTTTIYTITATNSNGTTTAQATVSLDTTPPTVPTNLAVTGTTTSTVALSWTASTDNVGVAGYQIFRNGIQVGTTTTATTFTNIGLTASTTYSYTVDAFDAAGNVSAQSSAVQGTTQALPPPPTIASFSANPTSIVVGQSSTLSWSVSNDTALTISNSVGNVYNATSAVVYPTTTTTYTITATNANGSTTAQATVTYLPTPRLPLFPRIFRRRASEPPPPPFPGLPLRIMWAWWDTRYIEEEPR